MQGEQLAASAPANHAALSASAGTGKTHVLTSRVLRLLLAGVDPASILCLTFTKAGAAEMADRIHARLAHWVRLKDAELRKELFSLDEKNDPESLATARKLFARVLESTGGGLRIETIHAFAQSLLAAFPAEAGLAPGFRPLEGREEQLLARATLSDLLVRAEAQGDDRLILDVQALSLRLGEDGAEGFLMACARAGAGLAALGPREGIEARLRLAFDPPLGDVEEAVAAACGDEKFDIAALRRLSAMNAAWGTGKGLERADLCARWLAAAPAERAAMLADLHSVWAKADGDSRSFGKGQAPQDPDYGDLASALFDCCARLLEMRRTAAYVADLAAGLRAGQAFAGAYAAAKIAHGVVDFDDLIARAEAMLRTEGMSDWIRYKLDRQTDHILVDEAQDTNEAQWNIVGALAEEFFAGEGASGRHRTLFTVGDFKQAIFSFQGTNPREFEKARAHFAERARALRRAAEDADRRQLPPDFLDLSMDRSFRSAPEILTTVDAVVQHLSHDALGLPRPPNPHGSVHSGRPGSVTLWKAFADDADGEDTGEEGWVSDRLRSYAQKLARQVRDWLDRPYQLDCRGRPVRPEDILILVRSRGELAGLLVARLHAEGVPVAGLDRLRLSAPLAVQDLLAAARFAVQPRDDLNLASLLVSPLFGWSQERLYEASFGRKGALWPHLRGGGKADEESLAALHALLAMADFAPPHSFFEAILSGPLGGRRKLFARLGREARDPVEELLSAALAFETGDGSTPSLQAFLDWFARGDVEVVRDPSAPLDAVRVMTVHGSKGLQAPVVILADACADPARKGAGGGIVSFPVGGESVPALRPRKEERFEPLKSVVEHKDRLDREEHWRLLYVAMTRAEERLFVGGALSLLDRKGAPEASWHRAVEAALAGLGAAAEEDSNWGSAIRFGSAELPGQAAATQNRTRPELPSWLRRSAPAEIKPPRPLAPSAITEDSIPYPPPGPEQRQAALRGKLLHQLFERLPSVPPERRTEAAERWLEWSAGIADPSFRSSLVEDACRIIADPDHAELFGPDALAEAPIAAVIGGGTVVSGTVDRLVVTDDRILVADFKTGRGAPAEPKSIPPAHLRQMAVYAAALAVIFPGRQIEAALLYTAAPVLHRLPTDLLAAHLPAGG